MAKKKPQFSADEVIAALEKHRGLVYLAAKELNAGLRTVYDYSTRYPAVRDAIRNLKEHRLDYTEGKLYDAIERGELPAIFFHLKTQGKGRGYVERQELTGAEGSKLAPLCIFKGEDPTEPNATV